MQNEYPDFYTYQFEEVFKEVSPSVNIVVYPTEQCYSYHLEKVVLILRQLIAVLILLLGFENCTG